MTETHQRIEPEPTAVAPDGNAVVPTANGQPDDVLYALVPHWAFLAEWNAGNGMRRRNTVCLLIPYCLAELVAV